MSELFDCPSKKLSAKMGYVPKKGGIIWIFLEKEAWQYRIQHKDPLTQEQIEVSKSGFKTKKRHS